MHKINRRIVRIFCVVTASIMNVNLAIATEGVTQFKPDQGKLIATHGVSQVEGAGGGGLVPWALITGGGTRDSWGANTHLTYVDVPNYQLGSYGFAVGIFDRVEFSYARHQFKGTEGPLDGLNIDQDIYGAKVKLFGDAVYDQGSWVPQVAVGLFYHDHAGIGAYSTPVLGHHPTLGSFPADNTTQPIDAIPFADSNNGFEYYIAATKLFLSQNLLVNATVRFTKANQFGLLGFGGPVDNDYEAMFETSVVYLLRHNFAVGAEYRMKPDNIKNIAGHPLGATSIDAEEDAWDIFAVWFPTKNVSMTAAYVDLGMILNPGQTFLGQPSPKNQAGAYLSLQIGF